jgi:23S rRNA (guanine1835-N2)-methyltransferase
MATFAKKIIMIVEYNHRKFQIQRYPKTNNRSLQALNAGDEYLLETLSELNIQPKTLAVFNDRFGALTCLFHHLKPITVLDYRSQEKACRMNLSINKLEIDDALWAYPDKGLPASVEVGVIRVPKSMELFRFYLYQLSKVLPDEATVYCAFMTRNFTGQMLRIAGTFFEDVQQSRAWKKSRLLILQKKKAVNPIDVIHEVSVDDATKLKQYPGVFSSGGVDQASRFLMAHAQAVPGAKHLLDLASGNGLLAVFMRQQYPDAEIHLLDDSRLAVESSKLNLTQGKNVFHWDDSLDDFAAETFDFVISNPPFHFEYETNIEVALNLFYGVAKVLKPGGIFQLVSSRHLNYKTHLEKWFSSTSIVAANDKFEVYLCRK